jgi:hypothetical protein
MSGMLLIDGETCWFEMIVENENEHEKWYRRFAIIRLSPDQLAEERNWHDLFRQHVGMHTDYENDGHRKANAILPQEGWHHFYDRYNQRTKPDYSVNTILGWFETKVDDYLSMIPTHRPPTSLLNPSSLPPPTLYLSSCVASITTMPVRTSRQSDGII